MSIQTIRHADVETLSFRQLDSLNGLAKGSVFKMFKARQASLQEGRDYFYLLAAEHAGLIAELKSSGQIYATTVNLVLLTRSGYTRLMQPVSG